MSQDVTPSSDEVTLNRCQDPSPIPVVTTIASVQAHQSLYISARDCLYAVNAIDGTTRWCQQATLTREHLIREQLLKEASEHSLMSYPPPPRATFAIPQVVHGAVYVCVDGIGAHMCAFSADNGELRWHTPTDGRVVAMPFLDYAVPLVKDGVVYSGTYALNEQDGTLLWRTAIDTYEEGALSLHGFIDDMLYATTQKGIYAINAQTGQIRWLYQPDGQSMISGPPVVADRLLYAGTGGSVGHAEKDGFFALDGETGAEIWRYPNPMGRYIGAVVHDESIYISSGDRSLYALDTKSSRLRWQYQFASLGLSPATIADDVLYINSNGPYALSCEDGIVLWHQPLGNASNVSFHQPVVLDGTVYLVRINERGRGVLYALDARIGAEYWHTPYPSAIAVALAQ
jgi:outer membrane protein assembly factor BamB